ASLLARTVARAPADCLMPSTRMPPRHRFAEASTARGKPNTMDRTVAAIAVANVWPVARRTMLRNAGEKSGGKSPDKNFQASEAACTEKMEPILTPTTCQEMTNTAMTIARPIFSRVRRRPGATGQLAEAVEF